MLKSLTIQGIGVCHRRALEDLVAALDHLDRGGFGKIVVGIGVIDANELQKNDHHRQFQEKPNAKAVHGQRAASARMVSPT